MYSKLSTAVLFLAVFVSPLTGKAQSDKDQQEITRHTLNMPEITHTMQATAAMAQAAKTDPSLVKKDTDSDAQPSLDQMSAKIASSPKAVAILSSYSLTPRAYAVVLMSMIQTGIAVAAIDAGAKESQLTSTGAANSANIAFIRAHKAEIDALGKKYPMQSE